jgi:hypothetical protein
MRRIASQQSVFGVVLGLEGSDGCFLVFLYELNAALEFDQMKFWRAVE